MADFILNDETFYHGTMANFEKFRPLTHFGTDTAANTVIDSSHFVKTEKLNGFDFITNIDKNILNIPSPKIIPVRLILNNTYELQDIAKCHDIESYKQTVLYHVKQDLKIDKIPKFFDYIFNEPLDMPYNLVLQELKQDNLYTPDTEKTDRFHLAFQRMIQYFEHLGYDGFHYINEFEDPGHISYVPFRPEQIIRMDRPLTTEPIIKHPGKIPEITPLRDMDLATKRLQVLEMDNYYEANHKKYKRFRSETDVDHINKYTVHYAKIFYDQILPEIIKISRPALDGKYGIQHVQDSVLMALDCAIVCKCDPLPVILACAFHDIMQSDTTLTPDHGALAVPYAYNFITQNFPKMHVGTIDSILNAIKKHSGTQRAPDITAACAWDGDRIQKAWQDIYKYELLNTHNGQNLASMPQTSRDAFFNKLDKLLNQHGISRITTTKTR